MTEEKLAESIDECFKQLYSRIKSEKDLMSALTGMAKSIYNKGIEDAVAATKLMTDFEYDSFQVIGPRKEILPDDNEDDYSLEVNSDGLIVAGESEIILGTCQYIKINKEEVLKLKIK